MDYAFVALPSETVAQLRDDVAAGTLLARRVVVSESGAPCRHCLHPADAGDELLLLTFQPFGGDSPYTVPSPIFIHAEPCAPYAVTGEVPPVVRSGLRAVRSYDCNHDLVDGDVVPGSDVEALVERLLDDERADYLHVYSATAGCFTCRIERRDGESC